MNTTPPPRALLCFDFDGTLVDHERDGHFDHGLATLIEDLTGRGAVWAVNTGRTLFHTLDGLVSHGIPLKPDFIIAREHEIYHRNPTGRWIDFGPWNAHCRKIHDTYFKEHKKVIKASRKFLESKNLGFWVENSSDPAGVVTHDVAGMEQLCEFIDSHRADWPHLDYQRNSIYLRFTHRDFNKGSALRELGTRLGLGPESLFAGGDNLNDLSMLRADVARGLCCPSNALPQVKAQVQAEGGLVAAGTASSGMAEGVRHFFYP